MPTFLDSIAPAPPDSILGLAAQIKADPRPEVINLSVGIYKDAHGKTPVLSSVKQAEARLLASANSEGYLPMDGIARYTEVCRELLLGHEQATALAPRSVSLQTPGGTAALRVAGDFFKRTLGGATIHVPSPTWGNHKAIFAAAGLNLASYPYLDESRTGLDFPRMRDHLAQLPSDSLVLLHACCHNPSGVDPSPAQWEAIAELFAERRLIPIVDFAYQGFGDGLDEDATGPRTLAAKLPLMLVAQSFSKNFSLYSQRVGCLTFLAPNVEQAATARSHLLLCARTNYSNPPAHGAAIVATIVDDPELRAAWEAELNGMRARINGMRCELARALAEAGLTRDLSYITRQRGMFSFVGLSELQVDALRADHGIYIVKPDRINVAGLTADNLPQFAQAVASVLGARS